MNTLVRLYMHDNAQLACMSVFCNYQYEQGNSLSKSIPYIRANHFEGRWPYQVSRIVKDIVIC